MLSFGNFRFAFKQLKYMKYDEIKNKLKQFYEKRNFRRRPNKMLKLEKIDKHKTWLTGSITADRISKELKNIDSYKPKDEEKESFYNFKQYCKSLEREREEICRIANKNTDKYLTSDYLDVYFATSMREIWEFEDAYQFIQDVIKKLKGLNIRYFDPTQSFCKNPKDKGLLEGLMLKRCTCTVYMAQEAETLGKDSELAATLAQKKPVIAYVPKDIPEDEIKSRPLEYFKKRFLVLLSEGIFQEKKSFINIDDNYKSIIYQFLQELESYRENQPFLLWEEKDEEFKKKLPYFTMLCSILAKAENMNYNRKAWILKESHPLAMQVDLESGVANGLLIVRSAEQCSELLRRILTNNLKFTIENQGDYWLLKEKISDSAFRVITKDEKLTNSFWNLWNL